MSDELETNEVEEIQQQQKTKKSLKNYFLVVILILSLIGIGLATASGILILNYKGKITELEKKVTNLQTQITSTVSGISIISSDLKDLSSRVDSLELQSYMKSKNNVDLTAEGFQNIGENFAIRITNMEKYLTGITIKGYILNLNSCTYNNAKFSIESGFSLTSKYFTVTKISPGYAASFSVYLPSKDIENMHFATIKYEEGSVSYYYQ